MRNSGVGILGDNPEIGFSRRRHSRAKSDSESRSISSSGSSREEIRLPPISEFGILELRKPLEAEIRLGVLSQDSLMKIKNYSAVLHNSNTNAGRKLSYSHPSTPIYTGPPFNAPYYPIPESPFQTIQTRSNSTENNLSMLANMAIGSGNIDMASLQPPPTSYQNVPVRSQSVHNGQIQNVRAINIPNHVQMYHCKYPGCTKSFPSRSRLTRHEIVHQGEKKFECIHPNCTKKFSRKDNMLQHYRNHLIPSQQNRRSSVQGT